MSQRRTFIQENSVETTDFTDGPGLSIHYKFSGSHPASNWIGNDVFPANFYIGAICVIRG